MHVLIADADHEARKRLMEAMVAEGHSVMEARSAFEAIALADAKRDPFGAVIAVGSLPPISQSSKTSLEHTFGFLSMVRMSFPAMPLFLVIGEVVPVLEARAKLFNITLIFSRGEEACTALVAHLRTLQQPRKNVVRQEEPAAQPNF